MVVKDIVLLNDGFFQLDMGMLVWMKPQYYGRKYRCALKSLIIITDEDLIMVDTGAGELPDDMASANGLERDSGLLDELRGLGHEPDDVTMIINTHLHFDHCGWNRAFGNARRYVQAEELRHAYEPHRFQKGGYFKPHFDGLEFEVVEGDLEIRDGVHLVATPGHTPGHQSVMVELAEKRFIFCGDCGPLRENIERRNVIGITTDPIQCLGSIDKLRAMDGEYIYAHDNEQMFID